MKRPLDTTQIDVVLDVFRQLQKDQEFSLYDRAHLSMSLQSFDQSIYGISEAVKKKILDLASRLEDDCWSHREIHRIIWGGETLEEDQVIRGKISETYRHLSLLIHHYLTNF